MILFKIRFEIKIHFSGVPLEVFMTYDSQFKIFIYNIEHYFILCILIDESTIITHNNKKLEYIK